jgi:L-amino acid N-acyltransferase YncA
MKKIEIIEMRPDHWNAVSTIYEQGIATKQATFQTESPSWEAWDSGHLSHLRYVAVDLDTIAGWAALSPVSDRCVYAGVTEVSVYINEQYRGRGIGAALLGKLIAESETRNIWTIQAGIFPKNQASIKLHSKFGFRQIGFREKIGKMDGVWRDTVLMERRSKVTGQD